MFRFLFVLPFLVVPFAGCGSARTPGVPTEPPRIEVQASSPFGGSYGRAHDFGSIPGYAGLRLTHRYPIKNGSDRSVRLLRAVNGKPCCGEVVFEPVTLAPGETGWLEVTLRVSDGDEPLSHIASVTTDHPDAQVLDFRTTAQPRPRFVLDRVEATVPSVMLGETKEIHFVARSYGLKERPAVDLDRLELASDVPIEWVGRTVERTTPEGLVERTRDARARLKADGKPGQRTTSIGVRNGDETIPLPHLAWQVVPVLAFDPKALFLRESKSPVETTVTVTAADGKPFEINEVTSDMPVLAFRTETTGTSAKRSIRVNFEPGSVVSTRTGTIRITTTHPFQPVATIGVFLTRSSTPSPDESPTGSEPARLPSTGESR